MLVEARSVFRGQLSALERRVADGLRNKPEQCRDVATGVTGLEHAGSPLPVFVVSRPFPLGRSSPLGGNLKKSISVPPLLQATVVSVGVSMCGAVSSSRCGERERRRGCYTRCGEARRCPRSILRRGQ